MYQRAGIKNRKPNPKLSVALINAYKTGRRQIIGCASGEILKEMGKRAVSSSANKKRSKTMKKITPVGPENIHYGSFWVTNGIENRKIKGSIPEGWYKGRYTEVSKIPPKIKDEIKLCAKCQRSINDTKWWKTYIQSGKSISSFVKEDYPYCRAEFYNMKNRIHSSV
jgi:hypothetical protein